MPGKLDRLRRPRVPNTGIEEENRELEVINREVEDLDEDELEEEIDLDETPEIDEETAKKLESLLKDLRQEDYQVRQEQIAIWKRLDYYWNNIFDIFYDETARDWRVPSEEEWEQMEASRGRIINIFRPHGEAIVAALSVVIPNLIFYPDDAENPDDLEASRAFRSITELLGRHNDGPMLFIRALVIMLCQGTVFGYNFFCKDKKFGTVDKPTIQWKNAKIYEVFCPECGAPMDGMLEVAPSAQEYVCPSCGYEGEGVSKESEDVLPQIVGYTPAPKSSVKIEVFSGLHVKIPMNAKHQDEIGYLLLEFQQSTAMLRSIFPERLKDINDGVANHENLETVPAHFRQRLPNNTVTVSALWLRPWQLYAIGTSDADVAFIKEAIKRYPNGAYALFIEGKLFEIADENLDEHWTISKNPLGSSLISRPLMENAANVQDIRADLVELELQTIEHGIPEMFVKSGVIDLQKYADERNEPGKLTAVKVPAGEPIGNAFHMSKAAILSQEVDPIRQHIDSDMQFVIGSFPSVYGGPATSGSKTASEYSQSRAMALQRLNTTWKIVCEFHADLYSRAGVEYANILKEEQRDERFVKKEGGSFVNQWIRYTSLTGRIGKVEPEANEQLPSSWAQKKDVIFQLIGTGMPEILQLLMHPRNVELVKSAIGLQELYVPGEDARNRQLIEFGAMAQGIPVPVNPELDNHGIHIEVLKGLLESPFSDTLDPDARQIAMMHLMEHQMFQMQQMAAIQESAPEEKEKTNDEKVES